jgi:hypothetical protein
MPLINCPECKKQVSDKAPTCPHCGYPIAGVYPTPAPSNVISQDQGSFEKGFKEAAGKFCLSLFVFLIIGGIVLFLYLSGLWQQIIPR